MVFDKPRLPGVIALGGRFVAACNCRREGRTCESTGPEALVPSSLRAGRVDLGSPANDLWKRDGRGDRLDVTRLAVSHVYRLASDVRKRVAAVVRDQ